MWMVWERIFCVSLVKIVTDEYCKEVHSQASKQTNK